jgi:hypothetical protein
MVVLKSLAELATSRMHGSKELMILHVSRFDGGPSLLDASQEISRARKQQKEVGALVAGKPIPAKGDVGAVI